MQRIDSSNNGTLYEKNVISTTTVTCQALSPNWKNSIMTKKCHNNEEPR